MIKEAIKLLKEKKNLNSELMTFVMDEITQGKASDSDIADFLIFLRLKGETEEEITSAALVIKKKCVKTELGANNTLDIVGTGGDMGNTFNISTACAFVAAAGGIPVAKHGNRAQSSQSGAIDVLEALGININKTSYQEKEIFNRLNLCFMFAQNHHPCFKYASNARKMLKVRTLFNILGPLTNPAGAQYQLFGIYDGALTETLAKVISNLGVKNALAVYGKDGIDEASISDETVISETRNGIIKNYTIKPEDFGLRRRLPDDIRGANAEYNAQIILNIFNGNERGAKRDIVILNSALAFYIYGKTKTIGEGVVLADDIINSGLVLDKLNKYKKLSNEV